MNNALHLIEACLRNDRTSQKQLYLQFKDKLFVLCLRYANCHDDAEDILQEGFIKIFRDLHQYKGAGSLEGWMRKVVLNVALQYVTKQRKLKFESEDEFMDNNNWEDTQTEQENDLFNEHLAKGLIQLMQNMPVGFRTVLNLYVLEGYTHQQIADQLEISVGTSKSQLNRAKKHLREALHKSLTN